MNGTITIPVKSYFCDKIAILVTPPQKNSQDYGGMFSSLAKSLSVKGIATLRFDNRSFSDTTTVIDERYTMFDQAEDVEAAFEAIQSDKRFNKSGIGLIGHNEGGMAAAIECSQNERLAFLVTLSACGIKGTDFTFQQTIMPYYYLNNIPVSMRNNIVANTHKIIQYLENMKDTFSIEKNFREYLLTNIPNINAGELEMHVKLWLNPRLLAFFKI